MYVVLVSLMLTWKRIGISLKPSFSSCMLFQLCPHFDNEANCSDKKKGCKKKFNFDYILKEREHEW